MTVAYKGRREDDRLLTGRGQYTADHNLPGQLYGHFLRADRAHADIVSLDAKAALAAPGVVAVLTGADAAQAGYKLAHPLARYPGRGGMMIKVPQRAVLAAGRVYYVGQEVALVVAETPRQAQDAAELIEVEYRELPVVVDATAALAPDAPQLHADIPGNLCFDYEYGDEKAVAEAISRAARVTRITLDAVRIVGNPMEPKACLAAYDAANDRYDLYSPTQGMSMIAGALSAMTGIPAAKLRVHARDVGGGFGVRSEAYPEYCAVLLAAKTLGRPVKWTSSRAETIVSDHHGRAALLEGELAMDSDGRFTALRIGWTVNAGAFHSQPGALINTMLASVHANNVYVIPALYGRHRLALTNTTPTTAYRGAARPNVSYLIERLVDEAAREAGIDRVELRRRNLIPKDAFPYKTATAMYDSGDPPGLLAQLMEHCDWKGFEARRAEAARRGRLRGLGCAMFIEPSGAGAHPKEQVAIKFGESGNLTVYALAGPSGQGHETVFPEIVGEALGLDPERIELRASDPDGPPLEGEGTIGSRSVMAHGGAMVVAAREVVKKGLELAAKALEVAAADIEFRDGAYRVRGTDLSIRLDEVARRYASEKPHPLDTVGDGPQPRSFPSGAHAAEVEIDPETGSIAVLRYVAVDDCGRVINPTLTAGQLHGGIVQGAGQVFGEQCVYDPDSGQLLTGSFMDYTMPRADEQPPEIELFDHPTLSPGNALGAKGAGEAGTTGAVPTLANAVIDALRPRGIHHLDFPYTPQRVWTALRK